MSHEEIVVTAIYFIDRDYDISGENLLFKRIFHRQEIGYIGSNIDQIQSHTRVVADLIQNGLMPLGQVEQRKDVFFVSQIATFTRLSNLRTRIQHSL